MHVLYRRVYIAGTSCNTNTVGKLCMEVTNHSCVVAYSVHCIGYSSDTIARAAGRRI